MSSPGLCCVRRALRRAFPGAPVAWRSVSRQLIHSSYGGEHLPQPCSRVRHTQRQWEQATVTTGRGLQLRAVVHQNVDDLRARCSEKSGEHRANLIAVRKSVLLSYVRPAQLACLPQVYDYVTVSF